MGQIKLSKLLNHMTLNQLQRLVQLDPNAMIEINDGVAEQILFEINAIEVYKVEKEKKNDNS